MVEFSQICGHISNMKRAKIVGAGGYGGVGIVELLLQHPEVEVSRHNIMGVVVPKVVGSHLSQTMLERGLGLVGGSPYLDEAADAYGTLIESIVKAAEMESTLKRLLVEIEATKRRVNALEFKVIPEMEEARDFIQLRLEEVEREETFRLKRFKNK